MVCLFDADLDNNKLPFMAILRNPYLVYDCPVLLGKTDEISIDIYKNQIIKLKFWYIVNCK